MSSSNFITAVPIFQGIQGKFYIINGFKYHVNFPIAWALDHKKFISDEYVEGSGPIECGNCKSYGCLRDVFVGYCGGCINHYLRDGFWRGNPAGDSDINDMNDSDMVRIYPYMKGVLKEQIGDKKDYEIFIANDDNNNDNDDNNSNCSDFVKQYNSISWSNRDYGECYYDSD